MVDSVNVEARKRKIPMEMDTQLNELTDEEKIMEFLDINNIHEEWIKVFQENNQLSAYLQESLDKLDKDVQENNTFYVPERNTILRALSLCPPSDIKVVIVGHMPVRNIFLATGLAFSFPENILIDKAVQAERHIEPAQGMSILVLHSVLVDAGFLEPGGDYDCFHESWAARGVLLLNASLTYEKNNLHQKIWEKFVVELLVHTVRRSLQPRVFFLCWGNNAKHVGHKLFARLATSEHSLQEIHYTWKHEHMTNGAYGARIVIYIGVHPTIPRDSTYFLKQGGDQFREIKTCYPNLFTLHNKREH